MNLHNNYFESVFAILLYHEQFVFKFSVPVLIAKFHCRADESVYHLPWNAGVLFPNNIFSSLAHTSFPVYLKLFWSVLFMYMSLLYEPLIAATDLSRFQCLQIKPMSFRSSNFSSTLNISMHIYDNFRSSDTIHGFPSLRLFDF